MRIQMLAVGQKMPAWVNDGFETYAQRMPSDMPLELIELPMAKRVKNKSTDQYLEAEAQSILKKLGNNHHIVVLDVKGKNHTTESLASRLSYWQTVGKNIALIIGGPDGLSDKITSMAQEKWSLSNLTLPHPMVRVIISEAIYRAWTVTNNHPYHRA